MLALDLGAMISIAGSRHHGGIRALDYDRELLYEREIRSVTAGGREFLRLVEEYGITATAPTRPLSRADADLADLKAGSFDGSAVLVPDNRPIGRGRGLTPGSRGQENCWPPGSPAVTLHES